MRFVFDQEKAAQAAAYLLAKHGSRMPYIKLLKMLYLADRQSLIETGLPITGAKMVSMDKGPVLSEVYRDITWPEDHPTPWRALISPPIGDFEVELRAEANFRHLSPYERDVLDEISTNFGKMDRWAIVKYTHTLPEWKDPDGSSLPIDVRLILEDAGKSDEEIRDIAAQVESVRSFKTLTVR